MGNMHGDEPTGRQLCLAYALDLVTSESAIAASLRDRAHSIIIPTLNPDGFDLHSRENKCGPASPCTGVSSGGIPGLSQTYTLSSQ